MYVLRSFVVISHMKYEIDDRPSVTETDRGGVFEMDGQTNRQKKGKCH